MLWQALYSLLRHFRADTSRSLISHRITRHMMDRIFGEVQKKENGCLTWSMLENVSSVRRRVIVANMCPDDPQAEEEPLYESHAFTPRQSSSTTSTKANRFAAIGPMPQTCPLDSPMRAEDFVYGVASKEWNGTEMPELPEGTSATFVQNPVSYLDVCRNRALSLSAGSND